MLEKKICPDSDSESVSDSFTLSSLSSPDYTIDSIASPVDNGLLMDNAQDMSSTLNISPNTIECAATIVSLAYASTNNTPQKTAQPEGDNVIGTTEHTKGAQHQHQLEEVNTPQPNEDNRASTSGTYNTSKKYCIVYLYMMRRAYVLCGKLKKYCIYIYLGRNAGRGDILFVFCVVAICWYCRVAR